MRFHLNSSEITPPESQLIPSGAIPNTQIVLKHYFFARQWNSDVVALLFFAPSGKSESRLSLAHVFRKAKTFHSEFTSQSEYPAKLGNVISVFCLPAIIPAS